MNKAHEQNQQIAQDLYKDQNQRLSVAREIARNLYRKHFHNYFTFTEYSAVFSWLNNALTITSDGLVAGGKPIPEVYSSKDVWRIAKHIRCDAYRAIRKKTEDKHEELRQTLISIEKEAKRLESRRASVQQQREESSKRLRTLRR